MQIDTRNLSCPQPLILVRKFIAQYPDLRFEVLVDFGAALENVSRFLKASHKNFVQKDLEGFSSLDVSGASDAVLQRNLPDESPPTLSIAVLLLSEFIGTGDESIGRMLLHSFLKTLPEVSPPVTVIALMNSAVKVACENSEYINALEHLVSKGTKVYVCGMCLDYFKLKDKLRVGTLSNMFEITTLLVNADKVLKY